MVSGLGHSSPLWQTLNHQVDFVFPPISRMNPAMGVPIPDVSVCVHLQSIDIIRLMNQYVHAIKTEFRQFDRPLRGISATHFHYR